MCDLLTDVSEVDEAVLADVGAGAGLRRHDGAGAALFIADDAELRRLDATWQVHVEHGAQLLQQLHNTQHSSGRASLSDWVTLPPSADWLITVHGSAVRRQTIGF